MNKKLYMILLIAAISPLVTAEFKTPKSIKKIKNFFSGHKLEKIDQRELPAMSLKTISIDNIHGPISIKTGWKNDSLFLKTTKRAKKQEDLNNIKIVVNQPEAHHLAITTKHINKKLQGSVEYELIIPASLNVELTISGHGDAFIKDVNGTICVVANDNITTTNTKGFVSVKTLKKGSIFVVNAQEAVNAQSHQGNITGEDIANSFNAHSTTGKVAVNYKTVPESSNINLETLSGNIILALPTDTNANIRSHTNNGTITSDHYITLKPYVTKLNNVAWNKFKKEVDGTLGLGGANIELHTMRGNVKILETRAT